MIFSAYYFCMNTKIYGDFQICISVPLSNIWGSIHWKTKQHWGWVEKSVVYIKKRVFILSVLLWLIPKNTHMAWSILCIVSSMLFFSKFRFQLILGCKNAKHLRGKSKDFSRDSNKVLRYEHQITSGREARNSSPASFLH